MNASILQTVNKMYLVDVILPSVAYIRPMELARNLRSGLIHCITQKNGHQATPKKKQK